MNAILRFDMDEVTRLTRSGRLMDATLLLRKGLAGSPAPGPHSEEMRTVDMQRPATSDGVWRLVPAADPDVSRERRSRIEVQPRPRLDFGSLLAKRRPLRNLDPLPEGASFRSLAVTNAAGTLGYKLYVPSTLGTAPPALIVMLHGCTQDADDFASGTRMNELAEAHGFLVAYPMQTQAANASRCWNWFKSGDQTRGRGEPSLIADATRAILVEHAVDPKRVFVAGLSAGGAAAAIMGCAYPDIYSGVGVHSGLACGAASDLQSAFAAMRGGTRRHGARAENPVPTIVFHGLADRTVSPANADDVLDQTSSQAGLRKTARCSTSDGMAYTRTIWRDADGRTTREQWMIDDIGHAWSGGSPAGSYTAARGPDASREMLRFFGILMDRDDHDREQERCTGVT